MNKEDVKVKQQKLIALTGAFCAQKLDDDYYKLCEKLIKKLARKREVPFARGKLEIWAAAIIHAIGSINFLFDKSFEPYVSGEEISQFFGVKSTTASAKASQIKEMLKLRHYDSEFSTSKMQDSNPYNNFVMVDGFIVPLESLPPNLQEAVKQVRASGGDISFSTIPEN